MTKTYQHALIPVLVEQHRPRLGRNHQRIPLRAAAARVEDGLAAGALAVLRSGGRGGEVEKESPGCPGGPGGEGYVV